MGPKQKRLAERLRMIKQGVAIDPLRKTPSFIKNIIFENEVKRNAQEFERITNLRGVQPLEQMTTNQIKAGTAF